MSAEAAAPVISRWLYGKSGSELTAEEKETVAGITRLLGTGAGALAGSGSQDAVGGAVSGSLSAGNAVENNALLSQKGRPYLSPEGQALFDRILKQGRFKTSEAFEQDYAACGQNTQCIERVDRAVKAEQARFVEFARTHINDGRQRELLITEFQKAMDAGLFQGSRHVQKFAPGWTAYGEMAAFPQLWYEDAQYRNYRQRGLSDAEARSEVTYQAAGHQLVEAFMLGNSRSVGAVLKGTNSSSKASTTAQITSPAVKRQPSPTDGEMVGGNKPVKSNSIEFHNKFPDHPLGIPQTYTISQLKNKTGRLNYIVSVDGNLVIGRKNNHSIGGGHIDLAKGQPVVAAGEVKFVNGKVVSIDNSSGHYEPHGISAKNAAIKAFEKSGFDVNDKYYEKVWKNGKWQNK
ncbi:hypothetical protein L1281_002107 [Neisseria sp. HSC-16F19]|nr:hypothetical protein [Neisseria sp. HSC-16F19]